jgi:hypothetical protein
MFATVVEARYLKCASHHAERGNNDLPIAQCAIEERLPKQNIRGLILEDAVPAMLARFTPAPASNSRQRPLDSASVTSTESAFSASRRVRNPAIVTKLPVPSSILSKKSLPF